MPEAIFIPDDASGGNQLVGAVPQGLKLNTRFAKTLRFVEPHITAHKNLVRADNKSVSMVFRHLPRFGLREGKRAVGGSTPVDLKGALDRPLIDQGRFDLDSEPCSSKQPGPGRARRSKNQTLTHPHRADAPTAS